MDSKQQSQVTTGILVILLGLVLLGGQLNMGLDLGKLWPLIFVVFGVGRLVGANEQGGGRGLGIWFLFLAGIFLLNNFRIVGLRDTWPLFIVAGGVALIFGGKNGKPSGEKVSS